LQSLQTTLGARAEWRPTEAPGHAVEMARRAAEDGFAVVGAAGGDGTAHEVANGLLEARQPATALAVFPVGSANDYASSLGLEYGWWLRAKAFEQTRAVDVGLVQTPQGRQRYFINGIGIGFNGAVTYESRKIRWLQGVPLYTLALLRALFFHYKALQMAVTIDGTTRRAPTLALSVSIGQREGNFTLAPQARLDDGLFDYLQAGAIPRWELLRYVPGMITGDLPVGHPQLWVGLCQQVQVTSEAALMAHVDGELYCQPRDGVVHLDIRSLPGGLRVVDPDTGAASVQPA
jgi:diacylglycerol kinase family enzyme